MMKTTNRLFILPIATAALVWEYLELHQSLALAVVAGIFIQSLGIVAEAIDDQRR